MNPPGISLIIPAFNAARYLGEALDSALNQTVRPRQIIVVDDGSTDNTLQVAQSYAGQITVLAQENGGTAVARNHALAHADQPLISFLDADDLYTPDKFERQLQALWQRPDAMLCICRARDFWSPELPQNARTTAKFEPQMRYGQVPTWLVRREVFDRVGTFNTTPAFKFAEGSELYSRIEAAGIDVARIEDVLLQRRLHSSNKTTNSKAHMDGIMALMKRRLDLRRNSA